MRYTPQSTNSELIEGCKAADRLAQKYLYQRYFGRVLGVAMRFSSDRQEAVAVVNQAFLKVFTKINQYEPTGELGGWIATIVWRTAFDHARQQAKYRTNTDLEAIYEVGVPNEALDNLAAEDLFRFVQQLPPATRTVFSLHVVDGYKHHEIAQMLDISEGTSKWHLAEAKKRLREMLGAALPLFDKFKNI